MGLQNGCRSSRDLLQRVFHCFERFFRFGTVGTAALGEVKLVAVADGPGSFTGLRVGVTTAKLFAYSVGAEVLGIDALQAIARQARVARHELRWLGNDARHALRPLSPAEGEMAFTLAVHWLAWFFCDFGHGPRLRSLLVHNQPLGSLLPAGLDRLVREQEAVRRQQLRVAVSCRVVRRLHEDWPGP